MRGLKENVIIGRLIPAGTGFNAYEEQTSPDVDLSYDGIGVFDDDADLKDVVLDDRTARSYGLDSFDERPSYTFDNFGVTPAVDAEPFSPILADDDLISDDVDEVDDVDDDVDVDDDE